MQRCAKIYTIGPALADTGGRWCDLPRKDNANFERDGSAARLEWPAPDTDLVEFMYVVNLF
jgi:hypothetical protein